MNTPSPITVLLGPKTYTVFFGADGAVVEIRTRNVERGRSRRIPKNGPTYRAVIDAMGKRGSL